MTGSSDTKRVLALDGGGLRGVLSMEILANIIRRIEGDSGKHPAQLFPHKHFDLIVGTSTGGILAILFGRLHYSIDQASKCYDRLGKTIFGPEGRSSFFKKWTGNVKFDSAIIERELASISTEPLPTFDAQRAFDEKDCRVCVTVVPPENIASPNVIRSYPLNDFNVKYNAPRVPHGYTWSVNDAARATSAAPTFFEPFQLGEYKYIDAGSRGINNPVVVAYDEAKAIWKGKPLIIISLGTGIQSITSAVPKKDNKGFSLFGFASTSEAYLSVLNQLVANATDTEAMHRGFYDTAKSNENVHYYRFNPQGGEVTLEAYWAASILRVTVDNYLADGGVQEQLTAAADRLKRLNAAPPTPPTVHATPVMTPSVMSPTGPSELSSSTINEEAVEATGWIAPFKDEYVGKLNEVASSLSYSIDDIIARLKQRQVVDHSTVVVVQDQGKFDRAVWLLKYIDQFPNDQRLANEYSVALRQHQNIRFMLKPQ